MEIRLRPARINRRQLAANIATVLTCSAAAVWCAGQLAPVDAAPESSPHVAASLSDPLSVAIPNVGAATPYPSTIETDFPDGTRVTDVDVSLQGLGHSFPADIDLLLVGPDGSTNSLLLSDSGSGTDVNGVNLTFDDEASGGVPTPIVSGTFLPAETDGAEDTFPVPAPVPAPTTALSNFDGTQADGPWTLYVVDDGDGDSGSIAGWSLDLETAPGCAGRLPTIVGTDAGATIQGTPGDDVILALEGNETIDAGAGNDVICAGLGDDLIRDGDGADLVYGEAGRDTFVQAASVDNGDVLDGGADLDEAVYGSRTENVAISLDSRANDGAAGEADQLVAIEDAAGGSGNDIITGNALVNVLNGNAGNDLIRDGLGSDLVFGGAGDDRFMQSATMDTGDLFTGGTGSDTVLYRNRADALTITLAGGVADDGAAGEGDNFVSVESCTGGSGNDTITGTSGSNILRGGKGSDLITGLGSPDKLYGDADDDVLHSRDWFGHDAVSGGLGADSARVDVGDRQVAVP